MASTDTSTIFDNLNKSSSALVLSVLENLIWPLLFLTFALFGVLMPEVFVTAQNVQFLMFSSAALGALALGLGLCLLSGNFDLSIGSIAGFSAMATALILNQYPVPGVLGIFIIIGIGAVIGFMNGFSIAYLGVNPFLQTLAFLIIFQGATIALSTSSVFGLPDSYLYIGGETMFSVSIAALLVGFLYLLTWFWLKYTRFGMAIYAVGGSQSAASKAGINDKFVVFCVFGLSGALSGLAGLILTGFTGAASPSLGGDMMFPAFAAAVIGGISLFGGRGNILGAVGGVLLLGTIQAGLVMMAVDPATISMINGIILLGAILLYTFAERLRTDVMSS